MGEYFEYANHDKKLKFDIGLGAENEKFSGIGLVMGTRAFCLLLTESKRIQKVYSHTLIGTWVGDRVSCIGDYTKRYEDGSISSYRDITANAIVMLYQIDGAERLIDLASRNDYFFVQLGYLICTNQFNNLLSDFEGSFGREWTKKYKTILESDFYGRLYDLVSI